MGRINSSNNLGRRGGLSNASPFVRFAAGFSGLAPQLFEQERKQREAQQKERQKKLKESSDTAKKLLTDTVKNISKATSEEQLKPLFRPEIFIPIKTAMVEGLVNGGMSEEQAEAVVSAELTGGLNEARANFAKALGTREGEKKTAEAAVTGVPVGGPNFINARLPDSTTRIVNRNDAAAIAQLPDGTQLFQSVVQPESVEGLGPAGSREREDARRTVVETTGNIASLSKSLDDFEKTQGAAGLRGTIAEVAGGLASQIPLIGDSAGEAISQFVGGASQEQITKTRTRARLNTSRMLRTVTQETSGRYTKDERELAGEINKTLSPEASFAQIRAALIVLIETDFASRERAKIRAGGPGMSKFVGEPNLEVLAPEMLKLTKLGLRSEEAADFILRLVDEMNDLTGQLGGNQ